MRRIKTVLSLLLVFALCAAAAETLTLPEGLKQAGERAFFADTSLDRVILPEGIERIEGGAFARSSVKSINLPDSLTYIASDAFQSTDVDEVKVNPGTYAYDRALSVGLIKHSLETGTYDIKIAQGATAEGVFTAPYTGVFRFYTTGSEDTYAILCDSDFKRLTYDDDSGELRNFSLSAPLTLGQTVYLGMRFFGSTDEVQVSLTVEGTKNANTLGLGDNTVALGADETAECFFTAPYSGIFSFEAAGENCEIRLGSREESFHDTETCVLVEGMTASIYVRHTAGGTGSAEISVTGKPKDKSETTYRALLIGQVSFENDNCTRNASDVKRISAMLRTVNDGAYSVETELDLTRRGVQKAIAQAFAGATENDVSFFFYASHGVYEQGKRYGALMTYDGGYISTDELAQWLSLVPGKVIVIVGTCGSGALIEEGGKELYVSGDDVDISPYIIQSFAAYDSALPLPGQKSGELRQGKFYVMTASSGGETSWGMETRDENRSFNYFARWFAESAGETGSVLTGDTDNDGQLTLAESYAYVAGQAAVTYFRDGKQQHPLVYPSNSGFVLFTK